MQEWKIISKKNTYGGAAKMAQGLRMLVDLSERRSRFNSQDPCGSTQPSNYRSRDLAPFLAPGNKDCTDAHADTPIYINPMV